MGNISAMSVVDGFMEDVFLYQYVKIALVSNCKSV